MKIVSVEEESEPVSFELPDKNYRCDAEHSWRETSGEFWRTRIFNRGKQGNIFEKLPGLITGFETVQPYRKNRNIVGMAVEASGGAGSIGDIVMIYNEDLKTSGVPAKGSTSFHENMLQPLTGLYDDMSGIGPELCEIQEKFERSRRKPFGEGDGFHGQPWMTKAIESSRYYMWKARKDNQSAQQAEESMKSWFRRGQLMDSADRGTEVASFAGSGVWEKELHNWA